jgi:hypothetical protein
VGGLVRGWEEMDGKKDIERERSMYVLIAMGILMDGVEGDIVSAT